MLCGCSTVLFLAIVSDILSWKGFLISTRLSYAIYLTQFPVFFYNVGTMRHSGYYNFLATTVRSSHHNYNKYVLLLL